MRHRPPRRPDRAAQRVDVVEDQRNGRGHPVGDEFGDVARRHRSPSRPSRDRPVETGEKVVRVMIVVAKTEPHVVAEPFVLVLLDRLSQQDRLAEAGAGRHGQEALVEPAPEYPDEPGADEKFGCELGRGMAKQRRRSWVSHTA
ncbi:MAG: hypothetical protein R2710_13905 [Acidimicrobiales bacterium]